MGIYDDLRNNVIKASNKVNNYTFGKNVNKTLENLSSSYAEVIYRRSVAEKSFNELLDHRSNIYSSLLTLVSAKYYSEKIKTNIEGLSSFINAYNIINGDTLKKLKATLNDEFSDDTANKAGYGYLELFNQLKVAFGYPEDMVFLNGFYNESVYRNSVNIEDYKDNDFFFKLDDKTRVIETLDTGEIKSKVYRHGFSKNFNSYDLNIENFPDLRISFKDDSLTDNSNEFQSEFANISISTMNEIYNGNGTLAYPYIIAGTQDFLKYISILTNAKETTYFYIYFNIDLTQEESLKDTTISSNIVFIAPDNYVEGVTISHGETLKIPSDVKAINLVHDLVYSGSSSTPSDRLLTRLNITFTESSLLIVKSNLNLSITAHHVVDTTENLSTYEYETSSSTLFKKISISINIPNREAIITFTDTDNNKIIYNAVITESTINNSTSRDMVLYYIGELSTMLGKEMTLDDNNKPHITDDDQTNLRFNYGRYLYFLADLSTLIDEEFNNESASYIFESINLINSYAQSFTKIESNRESNDSSYSNDYIDSISQYFSIIQYIISGNSTDSSIVSMQASVEDSDNTETTTRKLSKSISNHTESSIVSSLIMPMFISENDDIETNVSISSQIKKLYTEGESDDTNLDNYDIVNLLSSVIPGLTSGISILLNDLITILKEINRYIKQYSLIFSISKDYSNDLAKSLRTFYSEITSTDSSFRRFPNNIKSYDEWSDYIMNYTKDGIYNLSLLYMGSELIQKAVSDNADFSELSNYAIACGLRNDLWDLSVFDSSIYPIMESEKNLIEKYDLIPSVDVSLEKISTGLKTVMPDLEIFDRYDLYYTTILNDYSNSNFENAVEMIFLKKIFSDKKVIMKTINDIFNTFNSIHCGFKDLLLEDIFFKSLTDICKNESPLLSEKDRATINELISNNQELVQTLIKDYRQVLGLLYSGLTYTDYIINEDLKDYLLLE